MATTTNFGWETPDDSDLVKDGAAAMRTLGNSIDASMADLRGGTSGQILSKNSNTDMDFTWIANDQGDITAVTAGTGISGGGTSGAITITNDMATTITAAGDIVVGTGNATYDNLPIGTTGQVLTADTTVSPYKVKWAAPAAGGKNFSLVNSGGTALTGATTVTVTGISDADEILVFVTGVSSANAQAQMSVQVNSDTGSNYYGVGGTVRYRDPYDKDIVNTYGDYAGIPSVGIIICQLNTSAGSTGEGAVRISGCNSAGVKVFTSMGSGIVTTSQTNQVFFAGQGYYSGSSTISSVSVKSNSGNLDAGTVYIYKSA